MPKIQDITVDFFKNSGLKVDDFRVKPVYLVCHETVPVFKECNLKHPCIVTLDKIYERTNLINRFE